MINNLLRKVVGSKNDREVKRMYKSVQSVNALEETLAGLSDAELQAKTTELRQRLDDGATLDSLLPEVCMFFAFPFAFVRVCFLLLPFHYWRSSINGASIKSTKLQWTEIHTINLIQ